jgi:hypothetical protein
VEPEASLRVRLRTELSGLVAGLDDELRTAAELALALGPRPGDLLTTRTRSYATRMHCSERTARRRMEQAIEALASAAAARFDPAGRPDAGAGWRTRAFSALLRLDTPDVELYEKRTVLATAEIDRLSIEVDLPPVPGVNDPLPPVAIDVVCGARILAIDRDEEYRHVRVTAALPGRLPPGSHHELCLHYRVSRERPIRDCYAIVPFEPCDHARLRVRFPVAVPPVVIWRLSGVPPRRMDRAATTPGADRLRPDGAGEVDVAFSGLRQGHGYGVAWRAGTDG